MTTIIIEQMSNIHFHIKITILAVKVCEFKGQSCSLVAYTKCFTIAIVFPDSSGGEGLKHWEKDYSLG